MKKNSIENVYELNIPKIISPEGMGSLSFVEKEIIPFSIKRVYYLYDVPLNGERGGHAHKQLFQVLIALSGSFELLLDDGRKKKKILLDSPNVGVYIPNGIWREMNNFSKNSQLEVHHGLLAMNMFHLVMIFSKKNISLTK